MGVGAVGAVDGIGGGYIDPLLVERYAVLNYELRLKRLREKEGVKPLSEDWFPRSRGS